MTPNEKIYEVAVTLTDVRTERISATSLEDLNTRINARGWRIAPCSVPREIEPFLVRE
ncbi:hypothetical protein LB579_33215 [Mesorhizobium sp. BR1-1-7]|uniref:hypothetical protein n=1 Tax=Mesorhizobium sp. BR1-1-7 TaxID=2876647 RepID=UPI001CCCE4EF|nr:hypothetical protein [Mesorhizobium sp. BR1-1-7]MBZ9922522.1 hypothetical protein [Mesorhizobium sp. BR1-1-7]